MPAKKTTGSVTVAEVEASLPRTFFVRRGHIKTAFGLSEEDLAALIPGTFQPKYLSPNKARGRKQSRALFVRSEVVAVARQWGGEQ